MQLGLINSVDQSTRQISWSPVINHRRFSHTWVLGKTGVGKSTALMRWALDDIYAGEGIALFDPHGDLALDIIARIPKRRRADVIWFNPATMAIAFNILDTVPEERKSFVASSVTDSFKAAWGYDDMPTPTLEQFLYNGIRALMDMPGSTLFGLKFLLTSPYYRKRVIAHCKDPIIADFWRRDFAQHMPEREQRERTLSTLNKIGALIADPTIRYSIAQPKSKIDFQKIMDHRKIFIASLPQGKLGLEKASLLGSLLLSQLHMAALSRDTDRTPFHVYIDECHHFAPGTQAEMLSGIRKFGVSLVLSHQYLGQLPTKLKHALMGTAETTIAFRIGAIDAATIEPEFDLTNTDFSLCELSPFEAYARIRNQTYRLAMPNCSYPICPTSTTKIENFMRSQFATDQQLIDQRLKSFIFRAYGEPSIQTIRNPFFRGNA